MIELRVLGAVDVTDPSDDADPATVRSRPKALALLVYLALASRDGPVRRDTLLGLFWPEFSEERARRALSQTLYTLRSALGDDVFDGSGQEDLRVRPEALACDACAFLDALEDERGQQTLTLYAGDFLKGFHLNDCPEFGRWADERRSELRRTAVRTALGLARESAESGDAIEVARSVRWALTHAPHDEGVLREGLRLLDRVGNRAAALDAYEAFAGRLREELELEPSGETERLVGRMRGRTRAGSGGHPSAEAGIAAANESGESVGEAGNIPDFAREGDARAREPVARKGASAPDSAAAGAPRPRTLPWLTATAILAGILALVVWRPWAGETSGSTTSPSADATTTLPAVDDDRPRIAVLPLQSLSVSEENAYLAAGLHEELLRRLSLVRSLAVISRTSVLRYASTDMGTREIAADLGVRYVMEGTVQREGDRLRVHVQLIDAPADRHVWAERFDRTLDDLFALQSEIAESTARELEAVITPQERSRIEARPTDDPIAYDLYLRAADLGVSVQEEYDAGIELLRRATRRDPGFALAHASLAWRYWRGAIEHRYPPLDSSLTRAELALSLDPALPLGHAVRGWLLGTQNRYGEARASLQRAVALNPSEGLAWAGMAAIGWWSGNPVEGAIAGRRGLQVDPLSPQASTHMAISLLLVWNYRDAAQWFERGLSVDATSVWSATGLAWARFLAGELEDVGDLVATMRASGADNPMVLYLTALFDVSLGNLANAERWLGEVAPGWPDVTVNGNPHGRAILGWLEATSGAPTGRETLEEVRRIRLDELESVDRSWNVGQLPAEPDGESSLARLHDLVLVASVLGDEEEQLRWFARAVQPEDARLLCLHRHYPWFDPIRDRLEFQAWLRECDERAAAERRELEAIGGWTPEEVLGSYTLSPGSGGPHP